MSKPMFEEFAEYAATSRARFQAEMEIQSALMDVAATRDSADDLDACLSPRRRSTMPVPAVAT